MLNATQRKYSDADTMREYEELTRIFKELEAAGKPVKGRIRDKIADALNASPAHGSENRATSSTTLSPMWSRR